jgi:hypothetical protein
MANTQLTLILPNLAPILRQELNNSVIPPLLSKLFNKACFTEHSAGVYRTCVELFSEQKLGQRDFSMALLRSQFENVICADPCYLHVDRDQVLMFNEGLDVSVSESQALIQLLTPLFSEIGGELSLSSENEWICRLATLPDITFTALEDVSGKSIQTALPEGPDPERQQWIRLWNEIQMTLFDCSINQTRQQNGKLPINSVWFWGKGDLNLAQNKWHFVSGRSSLLQTLSQRTGATYQEQHDLTETHFVSGQHLHVFNALELEGDWLSQLDLMAKQIEPYWTALKWAKLNRLEIIVPNHGHYVLTPLTHWKLW